MIIIEIKSTATRTREGTNEETGKPYKMVSQQIFYHNTFQDGFPSDIPRASSIQLNKDKPVPFAVGFYAISDESFYFQGQYQRFAMGTPRLVPLGQYLQEAQKQAKGMLSAVPAAVAA